MNYVDTKTTYLQMFSPPPEPPAAPPEVEVVQKPFPSLEEYRFLYKSVGEEYHWVDRILMPDAELRAILDDPGIEVYVLRVGLTSAGFAELDRRQEGVIELAYFGLFPEFVGQGLGKFFLLSMVHRAWLHGPQRLWVHTCDLDHPAALPNYLKAGFEIYDEKVVQQPLPG